MDNNNGRRIFVQLSSTNSVTAPGGKNNDLGKGGGNDQNHIYLCNSTNGENDVADARCDAWRATHAGAFGVIDANATDGDGAILAVPDPCADADPSRDHGESPPHDHQRGRDDGPRARRVPRHQHHGSRNGEVYLFDNCFENYFWNYDNNGLKHLELRFYHAA